MKRLFPYLAVSLGIHAVVLLFALAALVGTRRENGEILRPGVVLVDFSRQSGSPGQRSQARTDASGLARLRPPAQSLSSDAEVAGDFMILYPELSRQLGEEGRVEFLLHLNAAGAVDRAEITRTSGYPRLDGAALEAVRGARFRPARNPAGEAIPSQKPFHVEFRLED